MITFYFIGENDIPIRYLRAFGQKIILLNYEVFLTMDWVLLDNGNKAVSNTEKDTDFKVWQEKLIIIKHLQMACALMKEKI